MTSFNSTKYFQDNLQFSTDALGDCTIKCQEAGSLFVPSGRIVACDPFVYVGEDTPAFATSIQPGHYPVVLSMVHLHKHEDERVAFAMLRVSEATPEKWELALLPGQDPSKLEKDSYYGYPVDAGLGCFMSEEASCLLAEKTDENEDYYEEIQDELEKDGASSHDWVNWPLDESGLNAIIFSSGFGDGLYPSYWGYDAAGKVSCLVTDFHVIDARED